MASGAATFTYQVAVNNGSPYALNGTQVVLMLPSGVQFAGPVTDTSTVHGREVVVTLGRLEAGARATVSIPAHASGDGENGEAQGERPSVVVRSATAMPAPSYDRQ